MSGTSDLATLLSQYPEKSFIRNVSKAQFLSYLNELARELEELPSDINMPEGREGLLIYCLLKNKSVTMEDAGEFYRQVQGTRMVLEQSIEAIAEGFSW